MATIAKINSFDQKSCAIPWKLYPIESYVKLREKYSKKCIKVIHMVRHAEGTHNVEGDYKNVKNLDARLTEKGMAQCQALSQLTQKTILMEDLSQEDIAVITSPMTRCVQTALFSFPWLAAQPKVPVVALESIRETVNYACDRRRAISEISQEFPRVDFAACEDDNDSIWDAYRERLPQDWSTGMESAELNQVAHRAVEGFRYLQSRPEHHLVICSHSAFLRCILNWGQESGVPQMMPQRLDDREDKTNHKIFEYCGPKRWEEHMRSNYENCELRSFCMVIKDR